MSIVHPWLQGARVLDLFAGSGALGLEALSRGAAAVDFVEQAEPSLLALRANIERLEAGDRARVQRGDALRVMAGLGPGAYDIAFADPPYGQALATAVAERWLAVPFASILGVEHGAREAVPAGGTTRQYGSTAVTIYRSGGGSAVGANEPNAGAAQ